jgi:hypothetical protein
VLGHINATDNKHATEKSTESRSGNTTEGSSENFLLLMAESAHVAEMNTLNFFNWTMLMEGEENTELHSKTI